MAAVATIATYTTDGLETWCFVSVKKVNLPYLPNDLNSELYTPQSKLCKSKIIRCYTLTGDDTTWSSLYILIAIPSFARAAWLALLDNLLSDDILETSDK